MEELTYRVFEFCSLSSRRELKRGSSREAAQERQLKRGSSREWAQERELKRGNSREGAQERESSREGAQERKLKKGAQERQVGGAMPCRGLLNLEPYFHLECVS